MVGVKFPGECVVKFDIISVSRGWVGFNFPEQKRCVALEWPLYRRNGEDNNEERKRPEVADKEDQDI